MVDSTEIYTVEAAEAACGKAKEAVVAAGAAYNEARVICDEAAVAYRNACEVEWAAVKALHVKAWRAYENACVAWHTPALPSQVAWEAMKKAKEAETEAMERMGIVWISVKDAGGMCLQTSYNAHS